MVYRCRVCGYIFDEKNGKPFSELTECPKCKMGPNAFSCIDDGSKGDGSSQEAFKIAVYVHKKKAVKVQNEVRALCEQCTNKCKQIFGNGCEFYYYSDLGDYDMTTLERPFLLKLMKEIKEGKIDAVMVPKLAMIGCEIVTVLAFYKYLKENNVEFATLIDGKNVEKLLEEALKKL